MRTDHPSLLRSCGINPFTKLLDLDFIVLLVYYLVDS